MAQNTVSIRAWNAVALIALCGMALVGLTLLRGEGRAQTRQDAANGQTESAAKQFYVHMQLVDGQEVTFPVVSRFETNEHWLTLDVLRDVNDQSSKLWVPRENVVVMKVWEIDPDDVEER